MAATAIGRTLVVLIATVFLGLWMEQVPARAATCKSDSCKTAAEGAPINLNKFSKKAAREARSGHRRHAHRIVSKRERSADKAERTTADLGNMSVKIAEARAEMTTADAGAASPDGTQGEKATSASSAENVTAGPSESGIQLVAPDELNELDRAADSPSSPLLSPAVANARAEMREDQSSAWAQTSTIGKAFIVVGVMLTFASAARMFMA